VSGPLVAIPHWRAPTWERTKYFYDSLKSAGADYVVVDGDHLPGATQALLLIGGVDVDPGLYGEKCGPKTDRPNRERDTHELGLLRRALERDIPVLCVCRGHQLLNVAFGGSVLQDIDGEGHRWHDDPGASSRYHDLTVTGGRIGKVYGAGATIQVNSRHHQGVTEDRVGKGLTVTASAPDGFAECIESEQHAWVVGVQWHPERPEAHPGSDTLWDAFVQAAAAR
jgi:gamma-glutamyl-gamma-aminobutyrate hydrolase PuuD